MCTVEEPREVDGVDDDRVVPRVLVEKGLDLRAGPVDGSARRVAEPREGSVVQARLAGERVGRERAQVVV